MEKIVIFVKKFLPKRLRMLTEDMGYELRHRVKSDWSLVSMIFIETITACNLRCNCCPNSIYPRGLIKNMKKMDIELFHKIIDQLSELDWEGEIQPHHCGEPLLDDRIPGLIQYIKKKLPRATVRFFTNGELLNVDLYKILIESGVNRFNITQHLPKKSKGVEEVLAYRDKFGGNNVKFDYYELGWLSSWGGEISIEGGRKLTDCDWPCHNVGIDYAGNVLMCCWDYANKVEIGNINNEKLINIWNKPFYRRLRKEIKKGIFQLDICKKCSFKNL
jgi:radical SAM protein with 4Fe4S-binding SPASM domain